MLQSKKKSKKDPSQRSAEREKTAVVIRAASMLLCLSLGEAEARIVLEKHEEEWKSSHNNTSEIGALVNNVIKNRSALSPCMVSNILHFASEQLKKEGNPLIEPRLQLSEYATLFVNLAIHTAQLTLQLNEPRDNFRMRRKLQVGWGDSNGGPVRSGRLLQSLTTCLVSCRDESLVGLNDNTWLDNKCNQILEFAITFLKLEVLNSIGDDANHFRRRGVGHPMADDNEEEDGMFGRGLEDLGDMIAEAGHRPIRRVRRVVQERIDNTRTGIVPPLEVRTACVKTIQNIVAKNTKTLTNDNGYFDIPILLLNCLVVDKELSAHVAIALEKIMPKFQSGIKSSNIGKDLQIHTAAPLLPPLLTAATSESSSSRRLAVTWAAEVVKCLDSEAASALCSFMLKDADFVVSNAAKKCIESVKPITTKRTENDERCLVMFFDRKNELDMEILNAKLIDEDSSSSNNNVAGDDMQVENLCEICFEDDLADKMYSLKKCGQHKFCKECFSDYIRVKLHEHNPINCPQVGCDEQAIEVDARELLDHDQFAVWKQQRLESYITTNSETCRLCPGVDCSMIAYAQLGSDINTKCTNFNCQKDFCFRCGEEPHTPASCKDIQEFLPLLSSSELAIKKHTKPCPGCKVPVEKNEGCNHMSCTNCKTHFCWLCATEIEGYNDLDRHVCNRFSPIGEENFDAKERDSFYLLRYDHMGDSKRFAERQLDYLVKKFKSEDAMYDINTEDLDVLTKAAECLISSRHFLKYTYVVAWAWSAETKGGERKVLFENHQATLAVFSEKLASLTQIKLEDLHGEREITTYLRALKFHTCAMKMYVDRMNEFMSLSKF